MGIRSSRVARRSMSFLAVLGAFAPALAQSGPPNTPVTQLPDLIAEQFVVSSPVTIAPAGVAWFRFVIPELITAAVRRGLDIDTEGSLQSGVAMPGPVQDTDLALFNASGSLVALDVDDGSFLQGALTFGTPNPPIARPAPGDGLPFDGRDGELAAGVYFAAVSSGGLTTNPTVPFGVDAGSFTSASVVLRARYVANTGGPPTVFTQVPFVTNGWGVATAPLPPGGVAWFSCNLPTLLINSAVDIDTDGSSLLPQNDTSIALYSSSGSVNWVDKNEGTGLLSALSFGVGRNSSPPNSGGSFTASGTRFDGRDAPANFLQAPRQLLVAVVGMDVVRDFPAPSSEIFKPGWVVTPTGPGNSGTVQLRIRYTPAPVPNERPTAIDLPLPPDGQWHTASANVSETDTAWFRVVTPVLESSGAVDFDTIGSLVTPVNAVGIFMFREDGSVFATDRLSGPDRMSMLSFGSGRRAQIGNGRRYVGQHGVIGTPGLRSETTMYIGLVPGVGSSGGELGTFSGSATGTRFGTFTGEIGAGLVTLRARAWTRNAPSDIPIQPTPTVDFGFIGVSPGEQERVLTSTLPLSSSIAEYNWYKIILSRGTDAIRYLDIDTEGTAPEEGAGNGFVANTRLALYGVDGSIRATDDNEGVGSRPALSFGSTTIRPNVGTGGELTRVPRNGRDGQLASGTYWIGLASEQGGARFAVDFMPNANETSTVPEGDRVLNIRTNIPLPGCLSRANVAGPNQSDVIDDTLTADDIIKFLAWFFAQDVRSDVSRANQQPGGDGSLTADDIIVFLAAYFAGC